AQQPPFVKSNIYTNVGSINNKGIELFLTSTIMQSADFSWTMDLAANTQRNKLTSLSNDVYTISWFEFAGLPSPGNLGNAIRVEERGLIGHSYGKRFAGLHADGRWLCHKADATNGGPADMTAEELTA